MELRRDLWRNPWVIGGVVALGVWAYAMYWFPGQMEEEKPSAVTVSQEVSGMNGLRVAMTVDDTTVREGQAAHLTLRFENGAAKRVTGLRILDVKELGFWYQPVEIKAKTIDAGALVESAPVELRPSTEKGKYRVTVAYRVTGEDKTVHEGTIASPLIALQEKGVERWSQFWRRMSGVFTLPLFLGLIGFLLQQRQTAEARRQEIWKTLLPNFHTLSEKHYLPLVRTLQKIYRICPEDSSTATTEQLHRLMFEHLMLLLRMEIFRKRQGQFFFKDRRGELVVSRSWLILKRGSDEMLTESCVEPVLEKMNLRMNYREFCYRLATLPQFMELEGKFLDWCRTAEPNRSFARYRDLMEIMRIALYFEANRPFDRDWYGVAADFELKDANKYSYPDAALTDSAAVKADKMERIALLKQAMTSYKAEVMVYVASFPKAKVS